MTKKILFWTDQASLDLLHRNIETTLPVIQNVVDSFRAIGIPITAIKQLTALIDNRRRPIPGNVEALIFDTLFPETPAGFTREGFRAQVDKPRALATTVAGSLNALAEYYPAPGSSNVIFWEVFVIDNGTVSINSAELERIRDNYRRYATDPDQQNRLALVQSLCNDLNAIIAAGQNMEINALKLPKIATYSDQEGKFIPAPEYVLHGSNYSVIMF